MRNIFFVTFLLSLISCVERKMQPANVASGITTIDSTEFEYRQELTEEFLTIANRSLEFEKDAAYFELRIWTSSMINPQTMIFIAKTTEKIDAHKFYYNSSFDTLRIFDHVVLSFNEEFKHFVDSLSNVDYAKMFNQDGIPDFDDQLEDGETYYLEIFKPNYHMYVAYHCPEYYSKTDQQNKSFFELLTEIDSHIPILSPLCKSNELNKD